MGAVVTVAFGDGVGVLLQLLPINPNQQNGATVGTAPIPAVITVGNGSHCFVATLYFAFPPHWSLLSAVCVSNGGGVTVVLAF